VLHFLHPYTDDVALGAAIGAFVAFLLVLLALLRTRRVRKDFAILEGPSGPQTVIDALNGQDAEVRRLRAEVSSAVTDLQVARAELADAIRHVAVVRYDAFADMGGRLSFSVALLDDSSDGIVVTSINGRSETRTYAKGVKGGASEQSLSPEEQQAITMAMGGRTPQPSVQ
jgi:hypothetical protein